MAGVNKAILVGNLGRDPELRYTQSGQAVANFTLATTETWNDKNGERTERTEWHRIVVWGKSAEMCAQYLSKGRQAYVEGRIQTREWEDKEGQKQKTTEINAQQVTFLGGRGGDGPRGTSAEGPPPGASGSDPAPAPAASGSDPAPAPAASGSDPAPAPADSGPPPDDDIPF